MEARFLDENSCNGLDSRYNNTSRDSNLVEICLLPVCGPLCELCDQQAGLCKVLKACNMWYRELKNNTQLQLSISTYISQY